MTSTSLRHHSQPSILYTLYLCHLFPSEYHMQIQLVYLVLSAASRNGTTNKTRFRASPAKPQGLELESVSEYRFTHGRGETK
ncbi:hypothetical protein RRG08_009535 [Elysia crispata]|uniref:Uncharacterized protein n=1 Tax=Elysia crispata TaxID=231223 RepID=A0AAE1B259_9GAST|nr:hypothetical protein RRG08_009535 [Elysia crispata]